MKWKGFPHQSNTWEPSNSLNCSELLAKFEISWAKDIVGTKWSKNDLERQFLVRFKSDDSQAVGVTDATRKWPDLTANFIERCFKWNTLARRDESNAPIVLNTLNVSNSANKEPIEIVCEFSFNSVFKKLYMVLLLVINTSLYFF